MKKKVQFLLTSLILVSGVSAFAGVTTVVPAHDRDDQIVVFAEGLPFAELVPLYQCWEGPARMLSTNPNCESPRYVNQGLVGYVASNRVAQNPGQLIPLYRYNRGGNAHTTTLQPPGSPLTRSWMLDGVLGYVPNSF